MEEDVPDDPQRPLQTCLRPPPHTPSAPLIPQSSERVAAYLLDKEGDRENKECSQACTLVTEENVVYLLGHMGSRTSGLMMGSLLAACGRAGVVTLFIHAARSLPAC
uniref:Uncharacterized protein n=1 Tax=Timema cristinae TaxID=61476 RepID=A0A7R9H1C9_TIMCR|nr:unnamed protein product [Timema cristinae]